MILQEEIVSEQAAKIAQKIIDKINKDKKRSGSFTITYLFKEYNDLIKKNEIKIILLYNFRSKKRKIQVDPYPEESILVLNFKTNTKAELEIPLLVHEITHIIDFIKSNFKDKNKKSYNKFLKGEYSNKEYLVPYLNNTMEFNAFINTIKYFLENEKLESEKIIKAKNYHTFLKQLIEKVGFAHYNKNITNDVFFKKKFLSRLAREGIIPDFIKKENFRNSVKKGLKK